MACSGECTRKYYIFKTPPVKMADIKAQQVPAPGAAAPDAIPATSLSNANQQTIQNAIQRGCDKLKYPGPPPRPPAQPPDYKGFGLPGRECDDGCVCSLYKEPKRRTEVPDDFTPVRFKSFELELGGAKFTISGTIEVKEVEFAIGHCSVDFEKEPLTLPGTGG
jgi:hypothetical protein